MHYKTFSHNAPEFRIQKFSQNNPNTINIFQQITSEYLRIQRQFVSRNFENGRKNDHRKTLHNTYLNLLQKTMLIKKV